MERELNRRGALGNPLKKGRDGRKRLHECREALETMGFRCEDQRKFPTQRADAFNKCHCSSRGEILQRFDLPATLDKQEWNLARG
jgi:hypothetical protein